MKTHEALVAAGSVAIVLASTLAVNAWDAAAPNKANTDSVIGKTLTPTGPTFVFDALGGTSNEILVYPGPMSNGYDEEPDSVFLSGQKVPIICQSPGREVRSVIGQDNKKVASHMWVEITTIGGDVFWATETYGRVEDGPVKSCL